MSDSTADAEGAKDLQAAHRRDLAEGMRHPHPDLVTLFAVRPGQLEPAQRAAIEGHLTEPCDRCQAVVRYLQDHRSFVLAFASADFCD
ncbi:MAG: hypothetical protein ACJ74O_17785 [Frankiaceae bacterium]